MIYRESLKIDSSVIDHFIRFSGDCSTIHTSTEGAKLYGFSNQIAHGTILIALFSKVVGTKLSKEDEVAVCCGISVEWPNPVFLGDEVELLVNIKKISGGIGGQ